MAKNNPYRRWCILAMGVIALIVGTTGLVNFITDPYGLFRTDFAKQIVEPAMNFIKTRYIAENPGKFDCLIFGSSRVNGIDARHIKDAHCYNMHHPLALPRQHLENLRYLLKKGSKIKLVIVALDDFSYKTDPKERSFQLVTSYYPPVRDESRLLYYLKYFFSIFDRQTRTAMLDGLMGRRVSHPDYDELLDTGRVYSQSVEKRIEEYREQHVKDPKFNVPAYSKGDNVKETLEDLREMAELARRYDVRLVILLNPTHAAIYLSSDLEQYLTFQKELSGITDFYDFSGLNSITTNNYYYYETSHYRFKAGDMIIGRIFGDPTLVVPADFGVLVTKENVDRHIESLRGQMRDYILAAEKRG
jgi:hypothetical protein